MKWKITNIFLLTLVIIVMAVFVVNIFAILYFFRTNLDERAELLSYPGQVGSRLNPVVFTNTFQEYIALDADEQPYVIDEGVAKLQQRGGWVQVLDENGTELYSLHKPDIVPQHYTPLEMVHAHKYSGAVGNSTIFIGEFEYGERSFSYIIGFPTQIVAKNTLYYQPVAVLNLLRYGIFVIFTMDLLIVVVIGYLFALRLAKPMEKVIGGIQELSRGNYATYYKPRGIYQEVYRNLNELSETLGTNEKERREIEQMREEWITNISHDVKTPLASIKGYAELLRDPDYKFTDSEIREYAEIIFNKSLYMQSLLEDLSLTTRLRNRMVPLRIAEVNLVELVREVVIDLLNDPDFQRRIIDFKSELEEVKVRVDVKFFKRALTNLLYNALVHNKPETRVGVEICPRGKQVGIVIWDDGKGIAPLELKRIFERYYRGTNTGNAHKGAGLGMTIAQGIVKAHGGTIEVQSKLGVGTRFVVWMAVLGDLPS